MKYGDEEAIKRAGTIGGQEASLVDRVKRLEDIMCLNIASGCDFQKGTHEAGCDYGVTGRQEFKVELSERERAAMAAKEQAWRNDRAWDGVRASVDQTRDVTSLEEISQRVQRCTDKVINTAARLEEIGERVFGPLPEETYGVAAEKVNPEGTLDHTLLALNWLDGAIQRLERAQVRLEKI